MLIPSILNLGGLPMPNEIVSHFEELMVSLLQANQFVISFKSFSTVSDVRFPDWNKEVSSANIAILLFVEQAAGRSLIYTRKRKGPKMEPWGTPVTTGSFSVILSLSNTFCHLFVR